MNIKGTKKKNQVETVNIFEQQELLKKAEVISAINGVRPHKKI